MQATVKLRNLRITARKTRQIADLIRGKKVLEAEALLYFAVRKSAEPILKLLKSAAASAKNNFKADKENLYVSKITVDEGPTLKRWHPMSRGRAYPIMKRTSHITLVLSEIEKKEPSGKKAKMKKTENSKKNIKTK